MSTYQETKPTRPRSAAFSPVRPRQLLFLGIAIVVIALQLLAMDWVVSAQVDHAQAREAELASQAAAGSQRTGSVAASVSASSDGVQSPQGVSTVSYSPRP
ncbi:MAG: hypothetical protein P4L96_12000 [Rhodoferax sp.]|nr:hypothetical protein [Rhodoferax sp.]